MRPARFERATTWFEVAARNLVHIGNQQLRWPALVQIVTEPRGVPRKPYVFGYVGTRPSLCENKNAGSHFSILTNLYS